MQKETIFEGLKDILTQIKPSLDFSGINEDSQLVRDLGLDSLTILLLSLAIETQYNFKFEGNPNFTTVGEVISYIEANAK